MADPILARFELLKANAEARISHFETQSAALRNAINEYDAKLQIASKRKRVLENNLEKIDAAIAALKELDQIEADLPDGEEPG